MNRTHSWSNPSKAFHWVVALLIFTSMALGLLAQNVEMSPGKLQLFVWHKSVGITVLGVMILRLVWKLVTPEPVEIEGLSSSNQNLAKFGHWALYAVAILMPLSGWIVTSSANFPFRWFGLFEFPMPWSTNEVLQARASLAHWSLFLILAALVLGHLAMAFKHQLMGMALLQRMMPGRLGAVPTIATVLLLSGAWVALAWTSSYAGQSAPTAAPNTITETSEETSALSDSILQIDADNAENSDLSPWVMVQEQSSLGFKVEYVGVSFDGGFTSFDPRIKFDPNALASSSFDVSIDITSAYTGSPDMDGSLHEADWFDFATFPSSTFKATNFIATENGFVAKGVLDLKGVGKAVDFNFQWLELDDGRVNLKGDAALDRRDFGIGAGYYLEDETVGFPVQVVVDLLLEE